MFILKQFIELYDFYTAQITACDAEVQCHFSAMKPRWIPADPLPPAKPKRRHRHSPAVDVQTDAIQLTGVDLTMVDGLSAALVQTILSEIGTVSRTECDVRKSPESNVITG